jgi:hypothetical protein
MTQPANPTTNSAGLTDVETLRARARANLDAIKHQAAQTVR